MATLLAKCFGLISIQLSHIGCRSDRSRGPARFSSKPQALLFWTCAEPTAFLQIKLSAFAEPVIGFTFRNLSKQISELCQILEKEILLFEVLIEQASKTPQINRTFGLWRVFYSIQMMRVSTRRRSAGLGYTYVRMAEWKHADDISTLYTLSNGWPRLTSHDFISHLINQTKRPTLIKKHSEIIHLPIYAAL